MQLQRKDTEVEFGIILDGVWNQTGNKLNYKLQTDVEQWESCLILASSLVQALHSCFVIMSHLEFKKWWKKQQKNGSAVPPQSVLVSLPRLKQILLHIYPHIRIVVNTWSKCWRRFCIREEKKKMNNKHTPQEGFLVSPECFQVILGYGIKAMQTFDGHSSGVAWLFTKKPSGNVVASVSPPLTNRLRKQPSGPQKTADWSILSRTGCRGANLSPHFDIQTIYLLYSLSTFRRSFAKQQQPKKGDRYSC